MHAISASQVGKTFTFNASKGIKGWLRPDKKSVVAVDDISFTVEPGESLAFIGPNGAGKSTTIKMLTGILRPEHGDIRVLGKNPLTQRRDLALQIGTVFGQRSQLVFNLPLTDSFTLTAGMYRLSKADARRRADTLIEQFALGDFLQQPVRKLSLGQRMRAEVANALLHNPDIIFLDEPTIGLDVVAKRALRQVIRSVNAEHGTTIFLTSHDVGDIEEVCERTMIINHGQIIQDAKTADLAKEYLKNRTISVTTRNDEQAGVVVCGFSAERRDGMLVFDVNTESCAVGDFLRQLAKEIDVLDVKVEEPSLEQIIHDFYVGGTHADK